MTPRARPFDDGRWSSFSGWLQVFMEGGLPIRIRYLRMWDVDAVPKHASAELARIFGARFRVGERSPNGDYLEAPVEMA